MTKEEKIRIARQLEKLGVDVIEAGFAAASPGDFDAINTIAKTITKSTVCSLSRANERDVRAAAGSGGDGVLHSVEAEPRADRLGAQGAGRDVPAGRSPRAALRVLGPG